jgi:hypothetical protein
MPVTFVISMPAMNTSIIAVKNPKQIFPVPYPVDVQVANKIRVLYVELISLLIKCTPITPIGRRRGLAEKMTLKALGKV